MGSGDRTPASSSAANAFTRCASRRSLAAVSPPLSQRARGLKEQRGWTRSVADWVTQPPRPSGVRGTLSMREHADVEPGHAAAHAPGSPARRRAQPRPRPRDATRGAGPPGPAPPPSIGRRAVTTSREAGRVCVCVYVCGVCFVIRTPADAAGMAARSGARRRGRGAAPGTPSYIRTRPTEAHVRARSPHAVHHAVRFSHASRGACGAAPHGVLRRGPSHSETQPHNREAHLRNKA